MRGASIVFLLAVTLGGVASASLDSGAAAAASRSTAVCGSAPARSARCLADIVTDGNLQPLATTSPQGYGPASFRAAYGNRVTTTASVGIVAAYDDPNIQSDLTTFSKMYNLPTLAACASAQQTACFAKYDQRGGSTYPKTDSGWAVETSLDVESVHGQCPDCRINLIEAASPSIDNLSAAADEAVTLGAKVVSNSYGGPESSGEAAYDGHYHKSGVTMVVSSGDSGYGTGYPAASPFVLAVGGTTLHMSGSKVTGETAWNGAGSGCSQYEYKPAWQHDKKCAMRSIADVSADADPITGASIYDSYATKGHSGWFTVGGTSLAAPLVAGIIAANGDAGYQPAAFYARPTTAFRDISSGNNGNCVTYLCKAGIGFDGPTGLGVFSKP